MNDNFDKVVDLTSILNEIKCELKDIVDTYKIYKGQLESPSIEQIKKCDDIITYLGFDKQWG